MPNADVVITHANGSRGSKGFSSVCVFVSVCVCLSATICKKQMIPK